MSTSAVHKTAVASGMQVALHPLVIINITDHYTRFKIQQGQENPQGDASSASFSRLRS